MLLELLLLLSLFCIYFFLYVEIKINKNNQVSEFTEELTKKNLNNEIMLKLPFFFNASHVNSPIDISGLISLKRDKSNKIKKYKSIETPPQLFAPIVKSQSESILYTIKKGGEIPLSEGESSINFFFIRKGTVKTTLVHPKYKDNFDNVTYSTSKEYLWNNSSFKHLDFAEGVALFVPNSWLYSFRNESNCDCIIEVISVTTIFGSLLTFFKKVFNYNHKPLYNV